MTRNEVIIGIAGTLPERYEIIEKRRWSPENGLEEDRISVFYNAGSNKVRVGGIASLVPPKLTPDPAVRWSNILDLQERGWEILDRPLQED